MKKTTTIVSVAIIVLGLLLLSGCTKTDTKQFESKCLNSGGEYFPVSLLTDRISDYDVCECPQDVKGSGSSRYTVHYKDVKKIVWSGC